MLFLITGASSYQCRSDQRLPHFAAEGISGRATIPIPGPFGNLIAGRAI